MSGEMLRGPTLEEFRDECLSFLESQATPKSVADGASSGGSDVVALFEEIDRAAEAETLEAGRAWRNARFDAGLAWITGPERYGGRELTPEHDRLYATLEQGYDVPSGKPFAIGLGMVVPTILAHAQSHVKDAYLPSLVRGDLVACQMFSEPNAGSDLAGVEARLVRDGDDWVVTGQKVWTSGAHYSQIGEFLGRSNPEVPKHHGLTMLLVDMESPGIEVRPLRQMTGGASFNEVFSTRFECRTTTGWAISIEVGMSL